MKDKEVISFFEELRQKDKSLKKPDFDELYQKPRSRSSVFFYVAASVTLLLIAFSVFYQTEPEQPAPPQMAAINDVLEPMDFLTEGEQDLFGWYSPTDFLLNDY